MELDARERLDRTQAGGGSSPASSILDDTAADYTELEAIRGNQGRGASLPRRAGGTRTAARGGRKLTLFAVEI